MSGILTDRMNDSVSKFGMLFGPSIWKVLFQNQNDSKPKLVLAKEVLDKVEQFCDIVSHITSDDHLLDKMSSCEQKARLAFATLRHLRCRSGFGSPSKGRVFAAAAAMSVVLCGSESWPLTRADLRTEPEHHYFCNIYIYIHKFIHIYIWRL